MSPQKAPCKSYVHHQIIIFAKWNGVINSFRIVNSAQHLEISLRLQCNVLQWWNCRHSLLVVSLILN
jgi:hypothetical protein